MIRLVRQLAAGRLLVAVQRRAADPVASPLDKLTRREEDMLKLAAIGKSNRNRVEAA